jgi:hypothetical protein
MLNFLMNLFVMMVMNSHNHSLLRTTMEIPNQTYINPTRRRNMTINQQQSLKPYPQPRSCLLLRLQHQRSLLFGSSSHLYEHFCNRAIKVFSIILNPNNYYYYNSDLLWRSLSDYKFDPQLHKDVIVNYHDDLSQHLINFILRSTNKTKLTMHCMLSTV